MLVVLAITSIILLSVNMIFSSLSSAVSLGSGQSQVLATGRAVGDYLYDDFKHMVGPGNGGFLVIVNRQVNPALLPTDTTTTTVRDDQIFFIRDRAGLNPVAGYGTTYTINQALNASYVRVWYGHGSEYDGNLPAGAPAHYTYYGPGPFTNLPSPGLTATAPNGFACQWVLGRQALFLNGSGTSGSLTDRNTYALASADPIILHSTANASLIFGATDDIQTSLTTLTSRLRTAPTIPSSGEHYNASNPCYYRWAQAMSFLGNPIVVRRLPYAYHNLAGPAGSNTTADAFNMKDFLAGTIAQTHACCACSVSDFIVDFAATTNATHPNEPDYWGDTNGDPVADGSTKWYGMTAWPNDGLGAVARPTGNATTNYPDPTLTGARYDPFTQITDPAIGTQMDNIFVFEHGDVGRRDTNTSTNPQPVSSAWPYLIRIRYRVHDPAGKVIGADGLPGRLFEQILYVNRN